MNPILKYALIIFGLSQPLFAQDLPNPAPNIENISAGSFIIPMDNAHQGYPSANGSEIHFNNRAYGLVYYLLENGISVKWAIRSGKEKDEADFTVQSRLFHPSIGNFTTENFSGSAFIIPLNALEPITCQGNDFSAQNSLSNLIESSGLTDVNVYELGEDTFIDIRYTLNQPPVIGVLIDGTIDDHQPILNQAGIPYTELTASSFIQDYGCFSYISQSHVKLAQVTPEYADGVKAFVEGGGNFFAQCEAIQSYETLTNLMSTNGLVGIVNYTNSPLVYSNNDMPIMQFIGPAELSLGSVTEFFLPTPSLWKNFTYQCIHRASGNQLLRAADINGLADGGNLFYAGGHEYSGTPSSISHSNNQRIFLNSLFIPATTNYACAGQNICICQGESAQLGCNNNTSTNYSWIPSNGLNCINCPNPTASPTQTTTYFVTKTNDNCTASSVQVTVIPSTIQINNLTTTCINNNNYTVSFNIINQGSNTITINGNNGTLQGNTFTSSPITNNTNYFFQINNEGCPKVLQGTLNCSCNISATFLEDAVLCNLPSTETHLQINLTGNPPWQLEYSIDNIVQPSVTINQSPYQLLCNQVGQYQIISLTNIDNCQTNILSSSFVSSETPPNAGDNLSIEICDTTAAFSIYELMETSNIQGNWQLLNNEIANDPLNATTGIFTPSNNWAGQTLNYQYEVLGNKCPNDFSEISITIQSCKKEEETLNPPPIETIALIPNAFSPNNDGVNDVFQIIPLTDIGHIQVNIFNRWGQHIHSGINWNGTYKGEICNLGVYLYQLKIELPNGQILDTAGNITLIK